MDAKNGKVERIEYDGKEYAMVKGEDAQVGDLILYKESWCDVTKGGYYEVSEIDDYGDAQIIDDVREEYDTGGDEFVVFRAEKEIAPTFSEGDTLQVGDYAEVTSNDGYYGGKVGSTVKVTGKLPQGTYMTENADGSVIVGKYASHLNLRKIPAPVTEVEPETITHEGAQFTRVDREAKPGDVVVFTENTSVTADNYTPYRVRATESGEVAYKGGHYLVYREHYNRTVDNVKVYEPALSTKRASDAMSRLADVMFPDEPAQPTEQLTAIVRLVDGTRYDVEIDDIDEVGEMFEELADCGYLELPTCDHVHIMKHAVVSITPKYIVKEDE